MKAESCHVDAVPPSLTSMPLLEQVNVARNNISLLDDGLKTLKYLQVGLDSVGVGVGVLQ